MDSPAAPIGNHKTFHLSESSNAQYIIAVVIAGLVYYMALWYGNLVAPLEAASAMSPSFAMGTFVLLGFVLLLGPMTRMVGGYAWRTLFMFRKELGVVAFVMGLTHVYLAMFVFARHGPFGFYTGRPWSAYPGLAALVIMAILTVFSFSKTKRFLSPLVWWKLQFLGARTTFAALVVHVVVLRYSGWLTWVQSAFGGGKPELPPPALLGVMFALYILAVRIIDYSKSSTKLSSLAAVTFLFVAVTAGLFVPVIISTFT